MSATPQTVSEFVNAAKAAILAGNLDEAETLTKQAQALKSVEALAAPAGEVKRLDMTGGGGETPAPEPKAAAEQAAIKTFFISRFRDVNAGAVQLASEFYKSHGGYEAAAFYKYRAFNQFLRTGWCDQAYKGLVLYTPDQLAAAALEDGFAALKATQIESQDTLGGLAKAA